MARIQRFIHRLRWTAAEATTVLAACTASGLSLREFAARHGFKFARLDRWRRRLGKGPRSAFHEITPAPRIELGPRTVERFEVALRNGRIVRLGPDFDAEALRRLLAVVDDGSC